MICPKCRKNTSIVDNQCRHYGCDLTRPYLETSYLDVSRPVWAADGSMSIGQCSFKEAGAKDVAVEVEHWAKLNWSLINYGVPLINKLSVTNLSRTTIENILLRIKITPDYGDAWERSIPAIAPKEVFAVERINIPLAKERLFSVKEAEQAYLKTEITSNGNNLFLDTKPIEVLAYNEWYYHPLITESLAGFILPNCETVTETIRHAGEYLKKLGAAASFDGYQSKSGEKVAAMGNALYLALQKGLRIKYINPPASFEKTGQKILFPEAIVNLSRGTCLDLALFYAACIERIGLYPFIFLVPGHALLGLWLSQEDHVTFWENEAQIEEGLNKTPVRDAGKAFERYFRYLQERYERIRAAIAEGMIMTLNSTTFTKGADFHACREEGMKICAQADFDAVVDVKRARLNVKPMSF